MKEKLVELLRGIAHENCFGSLEKIADHLIANGVTVQCWVPVTERLPEVGDEVLVCDEDGICYLCEYVDILGGVWDDGDVGSEYIALDEFTHWMPLPDAPKDGDT